ncbi:DUF397 domain-containing protein [Amycolatopsis cihanbeyliensis]|uniref:Uncharacterized protein DUF397 n=1 Tax=Amycolatopsis cihanbeyliensis TaxID=1128664 RepID=A0A542CSQ8_AMYCI|nr:DUF397 domain-containing protein [Amycolatopsis cihanbeyliensis]TQI93824.1 uncharacterized protein DUF397 [Amycolatopsis cihanbeyliensis]
MSLQPNVWTKHSANGSSCVEVMLTENAVLVRNSNHPEAGTLSVTLAEWESHTKGQKLGVFDLPPHLG